MTCSYYNAAEMGSAFDTLEVLDESSTIKGQRLAYGVQFLLEIGCSDLSNNLVEKANFTPTRSWINSVLEDLEANVRPRRFLDSKRLEQFATSQQIYVSSTKSGYITREMFIFWVICFINGFHIIGSRFQKEFGQKKH